MIQVSYNYRRGKGHMMSICLCTYLMVTHAEPYNQRGAPKGKYQSDVCKESGIQENNDL